MDLNYYCCYRNLYYPKQKEHIQRNTWNKNRTIVDFHLPGNVNNVKKRSLRSAILNGLLHFSRDL